MPVFLYNPQNHDHAYLIVSQNTSPLGFRKLSSNFTYIFSIDKKSNNIYSSSIQNVDIFDSLNEAKKFLSAKDDDLIQLGNFLIGSAITESKCLLISVIDEYEKVASISIHDIYHINKVKSFEIDFQSKKDINIPKADDLAQYNFYFSPSLDLSSPFPYYYFNQINTTNSIFCFNRSFLSNFVENQLLIACVIVIKGFICTNQNEDLIYVAKFCNNSNQKGNVDLNHDKEKLECECELIFKKESSTKDKKSKVNYYAHAWRRGPKRQLMVENQEISEMKNYISKEILTRFNIDKVHFLTFNDKINEPADTLKEYFGIEEVDITNVEETDLLNVIQTLSKKNYQNNPTVTKLYDSFSISNQDQPNSLFTILDQNDEIVGIQDFIFRFTSSDNLKMTDIITIAFLKKLAHLILDTEFSNEKADFMMGSAIEAGKCLDKYNSSRGSQRGIFRFLSSAIQDDYFSMYSRLDYRVNKKFMLDSQHMNYMINKSHTVIDLLYAFPEPFIICYLDFLVYPQQDDQKDQNFDVYVQPWENSNSLITLNIPRVYKETWLHYDFRYIMKKSLQGPFDPDYYTPTSSLSIKFKISYESLKEYIKDIKIGVKKKAKHPFKFIVQNARSVFSFSKFGIDPSKERCFNDLIKINKFRIENHINCLTKNNVFYKEDINPWYFDLKSQLSKEKSNNCPLCGKSLGDNFDTIEIFNVFDPILIIKSDKKSGIKICQECVNHIEEMIAFYQSKRNEFILADNTNSINYSMKKWQNPFQFISNPNDDINLSFLCQFLGQDSNLNHCLINDSRLKVSAGKIYNLHFVVGINLSSIRIELNDFSKFQDDFTISVKFQNDSKTQDIELRKSSPFVYEAEFTDMNNIHFIFIKFNSNDTKSLINIKKIDIFGKLSKSRFVHNLFDNNNPITNINRIKIKKNYKETPYDKEKRIQHFDVSFSKLYGIFFRSYDSEFHSIVIIIKTSNKLVHLFNTILPQLPKDDIFYYDFRKHMISEAKEVSIFYLDCVPKITPYTIWFNGEAK